MARNAQTQNQPSAAEVLSQLAETATAELTSEQKLLVMKSYGLDDAQAKVALEQNDNSDRPWKIQADVSKDGQSLVFTIHNTRNPDSPLSNTVLDDSAARLAGRESKMDLLVEAAAHGGRFAFAGTPRPKVNRDEWTPIAVDTTDIP